jgi:hypothetical protein
MKRIILVFLCLVILSCTRKLSAAAICPSMVVIEYIGGAVDKPIYPVVIAIRAPTKAELNSISNQFLVSGAAIFIIPEKDLREAIRVTRKFFSKNQELDASEKEFVFTIIGEVKPERCAVDRLSGLNIIRELSAYFLLPNKGLSEHLSDVAKRL